MDKDEVITNLKAELAAKDLEVKTQADTIDQLQAQVKALTEEAASTQALLREMSKKLTSLETDNARLTRERNQAIEGAEDANRQRYERFIKERRAFLTMSCRGLGCHTS